MAIDPYRTLGLLPGATPAEVKRAYRRLAKALHPDSAGPGALPRFLALHEAYEQLTTGRRPARGPGAAGPAGSHGTEAGGATRASAAGPEPWRADPTKARTAREQARRNRTGSTGSTRSSRPSGTADAKPGGAGPKRRSTRKATLGSTSYDEARDPSDTTWAGASWYGPTSGEYWRVNPREYADPRKHGPEYQSRARRRSTTTGEAGDPLEDVEESAFGAGPEPGAGTARESAGPATDAGPAARGWATPPRDVRRAAYRPREPRDRVEPLAPLARLLEADSRDPIRRLGYALLAWAPIGLAVAAVIGQLTGCATYSATCGGAAPLLPWLAQAIILGLLLLIPALARVLAVGSLAVVLALLPVTAFLVAFGGGVAAGGPALLQLLLVVVWVAGVVLAIVETSRNRPTTASP